MPFKIVEKLSEPAGGSQIDPSVAGESAVGFAPRPPFVLTAELKEDDSAALDEAAKMAADVGPKVDPDSERSGAYPPGPPVGDAPTFVKSQYQSELEDRVAELEAIIDMMQQEKDASELLSGAQTAPAFTPMIVPDLQTQAGVIASAQVARRKTMILIGSTLIGTVALGAIWYLRRPAKKKSRRRR